MSLYGALYSGVSGLSSESSAMGAISDNITNINTVGYKATTINFQTLVTHQVSTTEYSPGGVQSVSRGGVDIQGLLQASSSATDMAISGNGFFVTNSVADPAKDSNGSFAYTRAGSFTVDKNGDLMNTGGQYIQGWPLTTNPTALAEPGANKVTVGTTTYARAYYTGSGWTTITGNTVNPDQLRPLNLTQLSGTVRQTSQISIGANLPSSDSVGITHDTSTLMYDALGNPSNVVLQWQKIGNNSWDASVTPPVGAQLIQLKDGTVNQNVLSSAARFEFTAVPSDGDIATINGINYYFSTGATAVPAGDVTVSIPAGTTLANAISALTTQVNSADGGNFIASSAQNGNNTSLILQRIGGTANATVTMPQDVMQVGTQNSEIMSGIPATDSLNLSSVANLDQIKLSGTNNIYQFVTTLGVPAPPAGTYQIQLGSNQMTGLVNAINAHEANVLATNNGSFLTLHQVAGAANITATPTIATLPTLPAPNAGVVLPETGAITLEKGGPEPAISFNGNGMPAAINLASMAVTFSDAPTAPQAINFSLGVIGQSGAMTQLAGSFQLNYINQDGSKFGNYSGVTIGSDGVVTALFDNGVTTPVFQIPLATFVNPDGLEAQTGNSYIATTNSGDYTLRVAGQAGAGQVNASSLEASTVDIGSQFTIMITTQRAYSAASKIITTASDMLDTLIQSIR